MTGKKTDLNEITPVLCYLINKLLSIINLYPGIFIPHFVMHFISQLTNGVVYVRKGFPFMGWLVFCLLESLRRLQWHGISKKSFRELLTG